MCPKMPFSHSRNQRDSLRNFQIWTPLYPFLKMDTPLAGNIIDGYHPQIRWNRHETLADRIVNIELSGFTNFSLGYNTWLQFYYSPFPFLKVHNTVGEKTPMSGTCSCSNSSGCKVCLGSINTINCLVVRAQRFLHNMILKYETLVIQINKPVEFLFQYSDVTDISWVLPYIFLLGIGQHLLLAVSFSSVQQKNCHQ